MNEDWSTNNPQEAIKKNLSCEEGKNIISYMKYINLIVKGKDIRDLVSLFDINLQNQIILYWGQLSLYEDLDKIFQKDIIQAIKNSYFEYSLISVSIYQQERREKFIKDFNDCKNHIIKCLFHGTQIDPISKIITTGFLYTRKNLYGIGISFTDMLDYVTYYCGGTTSFEDRRRNFGKTIPVDETFSFVGTMVFYDKDEQKEIHDYSYLVKEFDHFPTYEEIKAKYPDKMVKKNGIHFAREDCVWGAVCNTKNKGKMICNDYIITEKEQILPLYGLTLKRNEYLVIWREPNNERNNNYNEILRYFEILYKNENINVYIEKSTEKALELIMRKRFNKIILISSIDSDLGGKKFVEIARKILGFDAMVLFFSTDNKHLQWIQNFPNALYTNNVIFFEKYIKNYNEKVY